MQPDLRGGRPAIIAILRGITPARIAAVAHILFDGGIRIIEVPLNSPDAFKSIEKLARAFGESCLCGAGTVLNADDVINVRDCGGRLIVTPNANPHVIANAVAYDLVVMPGFATATEAFTALGAGARQLKLFPATTYGPGHLKALKAVLPADCAVHAVGGVGANDVRAWIESGAAGFGFGGELFRPTYSDEEIKIRTRQLVSAVADAGK